jgi:hypothetical protein
LAAVHALEPGSDGIGTGLWSFVLTRFFTRTGAHGACHRARIRATRWLENALEVDERHNHWHTVGIGSVCLQAKLGLQEALFHARLAPFPERN